MVIRCAKFPDFEQTSKIHCIAVDFFRIVVSKIAQTSIIFQYYPNHDDS
ncbi:hypothetical protein ACFP3I_16530 [Chryseobacterium arachidis]